MTIDAANSKTSWFSRLAHPGYFVSWSRPLVLPLGVASAAFFGIALWLGFFASPEDYQMGNLVRIMYIHVPNAILSEGIYALMAVAAVGTLVWRHPLADVFQKSAAPLGAVFTAQALFSGSLWGRPTWGTYWEWDGRMTSTLVLFFIYLGIIALWRAYDDQLRAGRIVAIVTLVGAVNIPIIHYSVEWWNTLHQPNSLLSPDGPHMPGSMLVALLVMFIAFALLFGSLLLRRMHSEILRRRADSLSRQAALGAAP